MCGAPLVINPTAISRFESLRNLKPRFVVETLADYDLTPIVPWVFRKWAKNKGIP